MFEWLEVLASNYRYTIQLIAATAMAGTLIYTLYMTYRDRGTLKASVFVREFRKDEHINPMILGQYKLTISVLMKNTTNHSVYFSDNSFVWGLPRFLGQLFQRPKTIFSGLDLMMIESHAEKKIDLTYNFSYHRRCLRSACTINEALKMPAYLAFLTGKTMPRFLRRFVRLYIYAEDGMIYKAKLAASYKKKFFAPRPRD